jgi:hypothetical protein
MVIPYPKGTVLDFGPDSLPPGILQAIGLVVAASAQTEHTVEMAIGSFLNIDVEYASALTTHMAAPLRDQVARAIAEIRIDDLDALDQLDVVLDGINTAFAKRNAIVHNTWCIGPDGRVFTVKTTARGRVESDLIEMTIDQVKADADLIREAGLALISFMIDYDFEATFPSGPRFRAHKSKAARKKRREAKLGVS